MIVGVGFGLKVELGLSTRVPIPVHSVWLGFLKAWTWSSKKGTFHRQNPKQGSQEVQAEV